MRSVFFVCARQAFVLAQRCFSEKCQRVVYLESVSIQSSLSDYSLCRSGWDDVVFEDNDGLWLDRETNGRVLFYNM